MTMLTLVFKLLNIPWTGTGIGVSNPTPEKIARGCGNVRFVHTLSLFADVWTRRLGVMIVVIPLACFMLHYVIVIIDDPNP